MTVECWRLTIQGKVQGVSYRASTQDKARQLGLTGWVANRRDGGVEIVAEGDPQMLQALRDWCYEGPEHAEVKDVRRVIERDHAKYENFSIMADLRF